jgi:hypothetical protein
MIDSLEEDGKIFDTTQSMSRQGTEFYRKLFGEEPRENIRLDENFWKNGEKVTS